MNQPESLLNETGKLYKLESDLTLAMKTMRELGDLDDEGLTEGIANIKKYVSDKLNSLHIK